MLPGGKPRPALASAPPNRHPLEILGIPCPMHLGNTAHPLRNRLPHELSLPERLLLVNVNTFQSALTLKFILTLSEYIGFYFLILLYQRNLI